MTFNTLRGISPFGRVLDIVWGTVWGTTNLKCVGHAQHQVICD
jgi:hypothetical protein